MKREVELSPTARGRLDRALADALGYGRAAIKKAFRDGGVRVGGRRARASDEAVPGGAVTVEMDEPAGPPVPEPDAELIVLALHPRVVVVDKPAGVAVHPLGHGEAGTLASAVVARFPECAAASRDRREGGAVQRLDRETSGCVTFARDRAAWEELHAALKGRRFEKDYVALVHGRLVAGGVLSVPLAQRGGRAVPAADPIAVERLSARGFEPRPAETRFEIERVLERHTLLRVRILTGVTHQIRAHLAMAGNPVVGDTSYGGEAAAVPGLRRHFLHAARVAFDAPGGGRVEAQSRLPVELAEFLERLSRGGAGS